jgi:acyl-CoA thioester hydrolase
MYRHEIRPRYSEIDMQRVVFNAHYLAYCDDAAGEWFRLLGVTLDDDWWDVMLKRADITWDGATRLGDRLTIDVGVARWGTTSFDVRFDGAVGDRHVFTAVITYVAVKTGTTETIRVPDDFRAAAGALSEDAHGGDVR